MADPEKAETVDEVELNDEDKAKLFKSQFLKNPEVLAALQNKLGNMVGSTSGYIQNLPKVVKRRIKALKKLQLESTKLEANFFQEVHALECKYSGQYTPLYEKRKEVVKGSVEPTDEECDFPSGDEEEEEDIANPLQEEVKDKIKIEDSNDTEKPELDETVSGIPEFWLTIFKNVEMIAEMIQEHDEPIIKHLNDIKVIFSEKDPMGFKLEFYFGENEHFTNSILTKEYEMKCCPDEDDPFAFEGPEIFKCKGCTIDWKKGKDITVRNVTKKQKHKSRGSVRTVTKTVQNDSFFNFFNPPDVPDNEDDMDCDAQVLLAADFEIGHFIRERVIPRAVLYFTGEAIQDDDDYEDEDDEEEEEDDDELNEEDDENDPDFKLQGNKEPQADCKQQ